MAVLLMCAMIGLGASVPAGAAAVGSPPTAIVSLGDSFISGEGGRWLGNGSEPFGTRSGTDRAATGCGALGYCDYEPGRIYGASGRSGCHRSDVAPVRSAPVPVAVRVNIACSGAVAANVWPAADGGRPHFGQPPQADALAAVAARDDVRMVVLTVGANDAGFGSLVVGCALEWARSAVGTPVSCRPHARARLLAALPAMARDVRRALRGVRSAMEGAGYRRRDYRLVVMGYASPLPPARWLRYPESGWGRLAGGCPIGDADAEWAAGVGVGSIDAALRGAALALGAEFLDVRHALEGHQLCDRRARRVGPEGPAPWSAEWVRRLSFLQGSSRESLHPNAYGQRALGACLGLLYGRPPGEYACRAQSGRGPGAAAISSIR